MTGLAEDGLQHSNEKCEQEEENEQRDDQGKAHPERAANPQPGPASDHTPTTQLERQEDAEDQDSQKTERPEIDVDRARRRHESSLLLVEQWREFLACLC